jgi:hypothetical protein
MNREVFLFKGIRKSQNERSDAQVAGTLKRQGGILPLFSCRCLAVTLI